MVGRKFCVVCFLLAVLFLGGQAAPPHIVFIVADDLGWNDVGWHNPEMITPNMDRLAKAGVILNSSYVHPVCTPSRNSFMTGYYPFHTGLEYVIAIDRPGYLPLNFTLLPQKLKEQNYATHIVGKWHLGYCNWQYTPTMRGFDSFLGLYGGGEDYYTHSKESQEGYGIDFRNNTSVLWNENGTYSAFVFARRAVNVIQSHDPEQPLFLYLPFQSVHSPLEVPKKYEDMYSHIRTESRRVYCGMVTAMDEAIGTVVQALEEKGLMDNLLLIFTTDNGGATYAGANNLPLRGAKTTLWEGGTKGSAFVYSKTLLKKTGYINTGMIHAVDWFPTLLSVAGADIEPDLDGVNQWGLLSDNQPSERKEFVYDINDMGAGNAAIRYKDWKLIEGSPGRYNDWYPLPKLTMNSWTYNMDTWTGPKYQLFNISGDPGEHFDVSKDNPHVLRMMQRRLERWKRTALPFRFPAADPKANPKYFGGAWSPGWC